MCFDTYWVEGAKMMGIDTLSIRDIQTLVLAMITLRGDAGQWVQIAVRVWGISVLSHITSGSTPSYRDKETCTLSHLSSSPFCLLRQDGMRLRSLPTLSYKVIASKQPQPQEQAKSPKNQRSSSKTVLRRERSMSLTLYNFVMPFIHD